MSKMSGVTATAAALLLAGCAGQPVVHSAYLADDYETEVLSYAAKQGGMLTEITGNPFAGDGAALSREVTGAFEAAHFGADLPFFTEVPEGYRSPYKVVVLFNPAPGVGAPAVCAGSDRPVLPPDGRITVLAVFCSAEQRVNSAYGSLRGATGPDDPAFGQLMRQISLQIFPPQEPRERRDGDFQPT